MKSPELVCNYPQGAQRLPGYGQLNNVVSTWTADSDDFVMQLCSWVLSVVLLFCIL